MRNGNMCEDYIDVKNVLITCASISSSVASAGYRHVTDADETGFDRVKNSDFIVLNI